MMRLRATEVHMQSARRGAPPGHGPASIRIESAGRRSGRRPMSSINFRDDAMEWLEADGLGGVASGTASGKRTRRYHALLLAAATPPTGRCVLVSGLDATVTTPAGRFPISSQLYEPGVAHPDGMRRVESFEPDPWPRWRFRLEDGTVIEQEIFVRRGVPVTVLSWRLAAGVDGVPPPEGAAETVLKRLRLAERRRRQAFPSRLHRAADDYIVRRGRGRTIVAGYPWFTDWGRDTFIALRGLCLATGRLDEAHDILLAWAGTISHGMLPNRFPDRGEVPEFNSVDASLWYIIAVHDFFQAMAAKRREVSPRDQQTLR